MSDNQSITADANLMHHLLLWIYNWTKEDFELAFKYSPLGWRYQWDKFQGRINEDTNESCGPLIATILNMDDLHQTLLFNYITTKKYGDCIRKRAENVAWMKEMQLRAETGALD